MLGKLHELVKEQKAERAEKAKIFCPETSGDSKGEKSPRHFAEIAKNGLLS